MSIGRRKVRLDDERAWIFNKMVDDYESRPPYPLELVDALVSLTDSTPSRVGDIGAGLGHLSLPLAKRGLDVVAIEPAIAMLDRLKKRAAESKTKLRGLHGTAEAIALSDAYFDLLVVADAIHFLDPQRAADELSRVLAPGGTLALITCSFSPTPFMLAVQKEMESAAPRRPRSVSSAVKQILRVADVKEAAPQTFTDETLVSSDALEGILRSISFIGPAMNHERYSAFRSRILSITHEPSWARTFTLYTGRRR